MKLYPRRISLLFFFLASVLIFRSEATPRDVELAHGCSGEVGVGKNAGIVNGEGAHCSKDIQRRRLDDIKIQEISTKTRGVKFQIIYRNGIPSGITIFNYGDSIQPGDVVIKYLPFSPDAINEIEQNNRSRVDIEFDSFFFVFALKKDLQSVLIDVLRCKEEGLV